MSDTDEKSVAEHWQERLTEARVPIGDGLEPELLADRYDVETAAEIEELTTQATKEMIRGDHTLLVLDDLDAAEEKLEDAGDYEVATNGGTDRPEVVCLCGSTRFKDEYRAANRRFTMEGKVVLSVGLFGHADGHEFSDEEKEMLDALHKQKIDLADRIHVINVDGYIGDSTQSEIEYARKTDTEITYLEQPVVTDGGTSHVPERDLSVPLEDAVGYLHIGVGPDCDPVPGEGYWIPVGEQEYAEERHPPRGHVIQYPKDGRDPSRVGDRDVPDHVRNWDYRGESA
ncbi:hypothetical protein [Natrinema salsiterrestre]|uniref:Uncharacterized protein n=1 Tax=Natrinema salsiterrestre TaxID=2950540 RepID=A0A9Q4Q5Q6_9EURY|nr:hypothetical protein [Natrinema salsiterrestre]MDF9748398.1 hypothetical protein [Natrinema salsiterrestre]